jgi:DNA-binding CsgD family transcriptional regulator
VASLSASDAERLLRFVAEAAGTQEDQPFTGEFLARLGEIVEADWVTYCELDRVRRRLLLNVARTGETDDDDVDERVFWEVVIEEHPVCVEHQRGRFQALKLSDFLTQRQLQKTRLYDLWFRPLDSAHELSVPIPSPLWHTKTFLFDRANGKDFTERDRLVLDLLQPHFAAIFQAARSQRQLKAALAELEHVSETDTRGILLLTLAGDIEFASPPASRLLREFFGAESGGRLPRELARWLDTGSARLVARRGDRELSVERSDGALVLQERRIDAYLTPREQEILAWVARGKTNAEIARLLWVAPSTVRKHLENVYAKLGVSTRTAAAARFLGLPDAEAS